MKRDIENATKAAQCASLLCDDLRALVISENPIIHYIAMEHLVLAIQLHAKLDRLANNLKIIADQTHKEAP